jgi:hypothetical protein
MFGHGLARRGQTDALVGTDQAMPLVERARLDGDLALGVEEQGGVAADGPEDSSGCADRA